MITYDDYKRMITALKYLYEETLDYFFSCGMEPNYGSHADLDIRSHSDFNEALTPFSLGGLLINFAADQISSLVKNLTEPIETLAPFTCVRSLLEPCALAAWFLDPRISCNLRIQRSLSHRYEGLIEEAKYARVVHPELVGQITVQQNKIKKRSNDLGMQLLKFTTTDLIKTILSQEDTYRLLSAVAHGHHWAYGQLGFRIVSKEGVSIPEKHLTPNEVWYLGVRTVGAYAKPIRYFCYLYGWDLTFIDHILSQVAYDFPGFPPKYKVWKAEILY